MTRDEEESGGDGNASRLGPETGDADDFFTRLRTTESEALIFAREAAVSIAIVVAIGLLLYLVSGVWPPMVAVESGSMEPHMQRGDLVFITEPDRFSPEYAYEETGVVPVEVGEDRGYSTLGGHGSVVVYDPPSRFGSPIIHRAHFWVEEGENWYQEANPDYVNADNCAELTNCPAPHAGFITKGDANAQYDQASGIAEPVRKEWVEGVARLRVPYLGYVRLKLAGLFLSTPAGNVAPTVEAAQAVGSAQTVGPAQTTRPAQAVGFESTAAAADTDVTGPLDGIGPLGFASTGENASARGSDSAVTRTAAETRTETAAFDPKRGGARFGGSPA